MGAYRLLRGGGWLPSRSTCWRNRSSQVRGEGTEWKGEGNGNSICQGQELEKRAHSLERKAVRAEMQRQTGPYPGRAQGYLRWGVEIEAQNVSCILETGLWLRGEG